ncbi:MAG: helix-turn-helix domain-containing protein [Candidatus Entotheonellia bacterium]
MKVKKKQQLEAHGWHVGSVDEFLGLSAAEAAYIDLKLALSAQLKQCRQQRKLTQVELAERLHSNQSRVAKMEAGDPSVSLDLLIRSLLALGLTTNDLARIIAPQPSTAATQRAARSPWKREQGGRCRASDAAVY